jgi:hypothetical protein
MEGEGSLEEFLASVIETGEGRLDQLTYAGKEGSAAYSMVHGRVVFAQNLLDILASGVDWAVAERLMRRAAETNAVVKPR